MCRSPRILGTLAVLIALALTAAPAAAAAPPEAGNELAAGVLDWIQDLGVLFGVLPSVEPESSPGPERRVGGSEVEADEPTLDPLDGSTCEPGTTERSCSMDPDG